MSELTLSDWEQLLSNVQIQKKSNQLTIELNDMMEIIIKGKIDKLKKETKKHDRGSIA